MKARSNKSKQSAKLFFRLQLQFTAIVSISLAVLVAVSFATILIVSYNSMELEISRELAEAIDIPRKYSEAQTELDIDQINAATSCMLILKQGENISTPISFEYMNQSTKDTLIKNALDGKTNFLLVNRHYRALSATITVRMPRPHGGPNNPGGVEEVVYGVYAIFDYTQQRGALDVLLITLICAYFAMLVIIVLVSYMLSDKVLCPVRDSLIMQKEFVANASHELKTPITIINANLDVIRSGRAEEGSENARWLDSIQEQTQKMHELVIDMLRLSSFEAASYHPIKSDVNLSDLLLGTVLSFEAASYEKNLSIDAAIPEGIVVLTNKKAVETLAYILCENAVKYSPEGGKIRVSLERKKKECVFSVINDGEIPAADIPRIFDRFYKSSSHPSSFGLGLALAKSIITSLGGEIACSSSDGKIIFSCIIK